MGERSSSGRERPSALSPNKTLLDELIMLSKKIIALHYTLSRKDVFTLLTNHVRWRALERRLWQRRVIIHVDKRMYCNHQTESSPSLTELLLFHYGQCWL